MTTKIALGSTALHAALGSYGRKAYILQVHGDLNFSRADAVSCSEILANYAWVASEVGPVALPQKFDPNAELLINDCVRAGFTTDDRNPNPPGLGLVYTPQAEIEKRAALAVTWADAPGVLLIHAPTGAMVVLSAMWHQAPRALNEAIDALKLAVKRIGNTGFSLKEDVWAVMTPGATTLSLQIDHPAEHQDLLIYAWSVGLVDDWQLASYSLKGFNLPEFVRDQLVDHGLARKQIEINRTNTMDPRNDLPSKRKYGSSFPSGILACRIT